MDTSIYYNSASTLYNLNTEIANLLSHIHYTQLPPKKIINLKRFLIHFLQNQSFTFSNQRPAYSASTSQKHWHTRDIDGLSQQLGTLPIFIDADISWFFVFVVEGKINCRLF